MLQNNLTDQATARNRILERIKKATTGRPRIDITQPAGLFVDESVAGLTEPFVKLLNQVAENSVVGDTTEGVIVEFNRLIPEKAWKNISCQEPNLAELLPNKTYSLIFNREVTWETEAVITGGEVLIANTGSVMVSTTQTQSRRAFVVGPSQVVLESESQISGTVDSAMDGMLNRFDGKLPILISCISAPNRNADIEKTLILGAHGPRELYVFISKEKFNNL